MMGTIQKIIVKRYKSDRELNEFEALSLNNNGILSNEIGIMQKKCPLFNCGLSTFEQLRGE